MKYLLVEAIKEEKKRGVLTEYEINSQYNLSINQQRSLSGGMTSGVNIGSFVFQSSMRNICKKAGNSSSSSSSSSTSSVLSTSSLMSNPNTKTGSKSTQQVSTIVATNELDLRVDYVDSSATRLTSSPSISSTSSSSSSSSSSSPPIVSNNNSNRCSIHEMLAIKSTTTTNSNMSQTLPHQHQVQQQQQQQQQQKLNQLTYLRFDRTRKTSSTELQSVSKTSTQLADNDQPDNNKLVWRLHQSNTELKKTPMYHYPQQSHHHHLQTQQQQQYDANYANSNSNSNHNSHHYSPMTSTCGLNSNNITSNTHLNANYQESNKRFNSTFNERASNMM